MSTMFKKSGTGPVLSRDERARQGAAVKAALAALGGADALNFLNSHHAGLQGRPLDLAIASDSGLKAVEAALAAGT
jgi:Protein of unknown function (DUF2384)